MLVSQINASAPRQWYAFGIYPTDPNDSAFCGVFKKSGSVFPRGLIFTRHLVFLAFVRRHQSLVSFGHPPYPIICLLKYTRRSSLSIVASVK